MGLQVVAPASVTWGSPFDVTVIAADPVCSTDMNYTGTILFTTSDMDPGVVLPQDYTFQASDAGMVTFPGGVMLIAGPRCGRVSGPCHPTRPQVSLPWLWNKPGVRP